MARRIGATKINSVKGITSRRLRGAACLFLPLYSHSAFIKPTPMQTEAAEHDVHVQ